MFFRFLLLSVIAFFIIRAIRSLLLRWFLRHAAARTHNDLGVDPDTIRDAEFIEVNDTEDVK